jgi:nicotinamide mononucleotide (NMN) deamidase PncC
MLWEDKLKKAGVSIHVIATGAGAGVQQALWSVPGSSSYLSGASFPYAQEETEELLGFKPEHFCDEATAVDLASAAYMKAYRWGGNKPVGLGITASVASEKEHRGDHRFFMCIITDERVWTKKVTLAKGVGARVRQNDGALCDDAGLMMLLDATNTAVWPTEVADYKDATELARSRFFARPFFTSDGKRHAQVENAKDYALMPGSFNPPHEGHLGLADSFRRKHGKNVLFEIGTKPPHKAPPTVQELLKRAKLLRGRDVLFTTDIPMYLEKAKAFPGVPLLMGADTLLRILDPKWGVNPSTLIRELRKLQTKLYVAERLVDGKPVDCDDIVDQLDDIFSDEEMDMAYWVIQDIEGRWDVSSTELRNKK